MSKIYLINNKKVPSVEYLNEILDSINNTLLNIKNNNFELNTYNSIMTDEEIINTDTKNINAEDVITDPGHKFLNAGQIASFADKPSSFEIDMLLTNVKRELEKSNNELYMKIINTPDVLNKLRTISEIIHEDDTLNDLLSIISNKVDIDKLKEHEKSIYHMNNNDRNALNILLRIIKDGAYFADWDAKPEDENYIKNKPESLPADGGNCDTICNHPLSDVINKENNLIIIDKSIELNNIDEYIKNFIDEGYELYFKPGSYKTAIIDLKSPSYILINGKYATISTDEFNINTNTELFNIKIYNSEIIVNNSINMHDCVFENCKIIFDNTEEMDLKNNKFINCKFEFNGLFNNNIVIYNRYINSDKMLYLGGNNILEPNMFYKK